MLDKLKKLNSTLTNDQRESIREIIDDEEVYGALETALASTTDAEAQERVALLHEQMDHLSPFDLFRIGMALDGEQRDLISDLSEA